MYGADKAAVADLAAAKVSTLMGTGLVGGVKSTPIIGDRVPAAIQFDGNCMAGRNFLGLDGKTKIAHLYFFTRVPAAGWTNLNDQRDVFTPTPRPPLRADT